MKTKHVFKKGFLLLITTLLMFHSCTDDELKNIDTITEEQNILLNQKKKPLRVTPVVEKLVEMGFSLKNIVEKDKFYLVEGDLMFSKNIKNYNQSPNIAERHYHSYNLVSQANVSNINVFLGFSMPSNDPNSWDTEVEQAINDWNNISNNSCVNFNLVTDPSIANIRILSDQHIDAETLDDNQQLALAGVPFPNGSPYNIISVNLNFNGQNNNYVITDIRKRNVIAHELGHCIGFRHTDVFDPNDGDGYILIPGTNFFEDPASIMRKEIISNISTVPFSNNDIIATEYLYGCNNGVFDSQDIYSITLNPIAPFCYTSDTFNINGTYNTQGAAITMCLKKVGSFMQDCTNVQTFSGGTYAINNIDLNSFSVFDGTGNYELSVNFTNSQGNIIKTSNIINLNYNDCQGCSITNLVNGASINGPLLTWPDITNGSYTIEFTGSDNCPNGDVGQLNTITYTQTQNSINLNNVHETLGRKCFVWKIKADCSDWSNGCLLGVSSFSFNPNYVFVGNCTN
ncbi:M57 family metalloprotease [uncultured Lacinutrix sp.]|uniref:M57 family metalloprotease n=1 Tax=uncultured Lacinutrix sp. TaxID=574032 RepID=UPI0026017BF7|nr:M57 family metalloprotease [uncultured Lacinutrix sp.]